ncbi:MAG TPA: hypothetical protein VHE35_16615 [Kofleriaceae bacterium]|nr:hypothetical protein [Kofleriaceae bacterium]
MIAPRSFAVVLVLACSCGGHAPPPAAVHETATAHAPPTTTATATSDAPACARPGEAIGVCRISDAGVTVQARKLPPGATVAVQLEGDYESGPPGCHQRWHQELPVDAGGVATARFDIPTTDKCRLLASMLVSFYVFPDGPTIGPRRFGTIPPP